MRPFLWSTFFWFKNMLNIVELRYEIHSSYTVVPKLHMNRKYILSSALKSACALAAEMDITSNRQLSTITGDFINEQEMKCGPSSNTIK